MDKSPIIIWPAEKTNLHSIWLLLHADGQAWSDGLNCINKLISKSN